MRFIDLLLLILDNLARRKARVALTAVGVVIGTAAVVVLVSLAIGLQRNANEQLYGIGDLTQIQVMPNYGEFGPGPMMVGPGGGGGSSPPPNQKLITNDSLSELSAIPGVEAVIPRDYLNAGGMISYQRLEGYASITGIGLSDLSVLGVKAISGTLELEKGTTIVGALIKQNFYDPRWRPGMAQPVLPDLMDATLKLTLIKYTQDGTEVRKVVPIKVTGVLAEERGEPDYTMYMSIEDVNVFNEWALGRRINRNRDGYSLVIVKAQDASHVLDIADTIEGLGYMVYTPASFVQGINSFYVILQVIFGGVGAIALLVAAIGIANTMAMAILERTREIGLMKAIGATNRDVLSVFLGEAAGIGFLGGLGGVLLGWSAGQILNVLALAYLAGQSAQTGGLPPSVAVYTPPWLPVFTLIFATFIGLISGLYPALRAATLIPVNALKYE
ncbi:MAG TPA: ABC transporter permease [Anaerolineales bacterium]